ncbi:MAG: iron ABC transporter permease [Deltaproteobacteria bacterium]|nr:iron ABC transporter permease [Deltaproteobacteria bacterium]
MKRRLILSKRTEHSKENSQKNLWITLVVLVVLGFLISLSLGRYDISLRQLWVFILAKIFPLEHNSPPILDIVVFHVRFPRILAAMLVGTALAASGAAYQGMFQNPLVSPNILGASAGAGFGAALGIYFSMDYLLIQIYSFVFGLIAVLISWGVSTKIRRDPKLVLVLSGILVGTLFTSGIAFIKYVADPTDKLPAITYWLMGSLASVDMADVRSVLIPILAGTIFLYLVRWRLNVLSLGEDEAKSLGVDTKKIRFMVIICATLMTSAAVSISGVVSWVGLVVPHLARMALGPNFCALLPASILIGSTYLLLVDDLARMLAPVETPLGILTSLIGAPFFIFLLTRSRRGFH